MGESIRRRSEGRNAMSSSKSSPVYERRRKSLAMLAAFSLVFSMLTQVGFGSSDLPPAEAAGGAYSLNFAAADPSIYIPPVPFPSNLTAPTGRGDGEAQIPLAQFNDGSSDVRVESLAPQDMALGQIVPFETKISVSGDTTPENGVITFQQGWSIETTNGGDFGYDESLGVIGAFVDTGDGAHSDPGADAIVSSFSWAVVGDEIVGTFTVSGLNDGDVVVVEAWLVLEDTIPAGIGGNVQSRLIDAGTGSDLTGDSISTGNQTVPLLKPGDFFNADVDLSVTKTDNPDPVVLGGTLTYTITATNAGPSVANGVVIYDELDENVTFVSASDGGFINTDTGDTIPNGAVQWDVGALTPGQTLLFTVTVTVNGDAPTDSPTDEDLINTVTITTISDDTDPTNNSDTEPTDVVANPVLLNAKSLLSNADEDGSETVSLNDTLTYQFVATNDGDVPLTNVTIVDPLPGLSALSCDSTQPATLAVDASLTCTATYVVTQADVQAGVINNTSTADSDQTPPVPDSETVPVPQDASLSVDKVVDAEVISAPQTLNYTITVVNTGNVDITNVVLTDDLAGPATLVSGDDVNPGVLDVGETWVYSATYDATQADINAGTPLVNTASVVSTEVPGPTTDDATTTITQDASLSVDKVVDAEVISAPQTLNYTITVVNTGNVDITNVVLTDDLAGPATLVSGDDVNPGVLDVGETWVYSATYDATQADINAGTPLVNTASVVSTEVPGPTTDDATTTITQDASLSVDKVVDAEVISAPQTLNYTITVVNTGNVDITNVVLTDDLAGPATLVSGDDVNPGVLDVGETWVYSATYDATQADINAGTPLVNTASVVSTEVPGPTTDDATTTITQDASLSVDKVVDAEVISAPQTLNYTITVVNTGNVDITNVVLTDDLAGPATLVSGDDVNPGVLDVGETWVYSATYDATQADINAGTPLVNTASVVSTEVPGPTTDDATTTITQDASLSVDKVVDAEVISAPQTLNYTITVVNTGNVDITNVVLTDDLAGPATLVSGDDVNPGVLDVGETWVYSATYDATQADINAGTPLVNTASVVSTEVPGPTTDDATTTITQDASLSVDKVVDAEVISAPQTLNYTITVVNTGNVDITNVVLTDDLAGPATLVSGDDVNPGVLDVGETWVYSATYDATQADINAGTPLVNTASVVSTEVPGPTTDDATTTITQDASLSVDKVVDAEVISAPQTLNYTITVVNTGNVDITNVVLTDDLAGPATLVSGDDVNPGVLDVGETWVYSATYDATQADINAGTPLVNTASVVSTEVPGPTTDDATTTITQDASLSVDKSLTGNADEDQSGDVTLNDTLTYTITATNSGNVTLNNVTVSDDLTGDSTSCASVAPGGTCVLTVTYVVSQADVDAGVIINIGTADSDETDPVTDPEEVPVVSPGLAIEKVFDPGTLGAGDSGSFTITVTNTGNSALTSVTVYDEVNPLLYVTDVGPQLECSASSGQTVDCTFDTLEPGESETVTVAFKVDVALPQTPQYGTTDGSEFKFVFVNGDVLEGSALGPVELNGVVIDGPGTGTKNDYYFDEGGFELHLSCSDSFTGGWGDYGSPNPDDNPDWQIASYSINRFKKGDFFRSCGNVVVPLHINNTAFADSDQTDPVSDSDTLVIVGGGEQPFAELSVDKPAPTNADEDGSATVTLGDTLTYTITATNTGTATLANVVVSDSLITPDSTTCASLAPTETCVLVGTYQVTADDVTAGEIVNTGTADSDETDPVTDDETVAVEDVPVPLAELSVDKPAPTNADGDVSGTVTLGDTLTYTITATNTGTATLTEVTVSDPIDHTGFDDVCVVGSDRDVCVGRYVSGDGG